MELRVLKYFTVVVQENNFSRAANILHVSESTLSRQIQDLELELNSKLLERSNRGLKLTDTGQYLYSRANELLGLARETETAIQSQKMVVGSLYIGVGENNVEKLVVKIFAQLVDQYPKIHVHLYNITGDIIPLDINRGLINFGFVTTQKNLANFHQLNIPYRDRWGLIVKRTDPLATAKILRPDDLRGRRILLSRQRGLIQRFDNWLGSSQFVRIVGTCDMMRSMHDLVKHDVGLAVTFDKKEYHQAKSQFKFLRLKDFPITTSKMIWKKGRPLTRLETLFLAKIKQDLQSKEKQCLAKDRS